MRRNVLTALAGATLLLAACGGGGGDDAGNPAAPPPPAGEEVSLAVQGTAAKGLIENGRVSAHTVKDGAIDEAELAFASTSVAGTYSLSFRAPAGQPVVIRVQAQAGDATRHADEISGQSEVLPQRFQLRGAILPADGASVNLTLTPFSEMAVAAAARGSGGLTAAHIGEGNAMVRQLLGFDPTKEQVSSDLAGATANQRKLRVMLATVSRLAADGAAGCASGSNGEKVTCVVEKLAAAAQPTTVELKTDDRPNLGAEIAGAVREVLADDRFQDVSEAVLTTVLSNLGCRGDDCKVVPPPAGTGNAVADAIAATKSLLEQVRSDFNALFVSGSTANIGDAETQAQTFAERMRGVQLPAEVLVRDAAALMAGIDLWNDFQAGRSGATRNIWKGDYAVAGTLPPNNGFGGIGCSVQTSTDAIATTKEEAVKVGCAARYTVDFRTGPTSSTTGVTEYAHGFSIFPGATAGTFTYGSSGFKRLRSSPQTGPQLDKSSGRSGTVTLTLSGTDIASFTITGTLPPAFPFGATPATPGGSIAFINDHHTWNLTATRTGPIDGTATTTVSGSIASIATGGATDGTLTIRSGSFSQVPDASGGVSAAAAALDLTWVTAGAEFAGTFSAGDRIASKDGAQVIPGRVSLGGTFTTIDGATRTDFASGTFAVAVSGFGDFDAAQPSSATNFFSANASFTGSVTAPNRPLLRLALGTSARSFEDSPSAVTLQYRSIVAGTPRASIDMTATRDSAGVPTFTLAEGATGISLSATRGAASADVLLDGSTKIGTLDLSTGILTFTDGSFVSAELQP